MSWKPIKDAPEDKEIIGVYAKKHSSDDKPIVHGPFTCKLIGKKWMATHDDHMVIGHQDWGGTSYEEVDIDPTHWMHLPIAPVVTEEE
jgi:hypothetical protein